MKTVRASEWRGQVRGQSPAPGWTSFLLISVQGSEKYCGSQDVGRGLCRLRDHLVSASGGEGAEWPGRQTQSYSLIWRLQCRCDCWSQSHRDGRVLTPTAGGLPRQHFNTHNVEGGEWEANAETLSKLLRSTQLRRDGVDMVCVQSPTFPPSRTHKFPTLSDEEMWERPEIETLISLKRFSFSQKGTFFPKHTKRPAGISGLWLYTSLSNDFLNVYITSLKKKCKHPPFKNIIPDVSKIT